MPTGAGASSGVVVVADDLTGAADTAVRFLPPGEEILLVSLADEACTTSLPAFGLAIDTGTRGSTEAETIPRLRKAVALVRERKPSLVYKKIDSQLRGRPGLEIEALRRELGLRCALVAPAHPDQGRVTRAGVHLVRGVPVAESEAGRDPVAPVTESHLPALIAQQAGVRVAHVGTDELEAGPAPLRRTIERLVAEGHAAITFDAVTRHDLELVAEVARRRFSDVLLAGSAGLATALAACRDGTASAPSPVPHCDSMLFVCGSTAGALRRQVAALVASGRSRAVAMTAAAVAAGPGREELRGAALEQWARGDVTLLTPGERLDAAACAPATVLAGLADVALALVARRRPEGLFLCGGDTAAAVLRAAGVAAVRLRGEAVPGAAWGFAVGGALDGVTVLMRAGAFGGDDDLVDLHRRCGESATHD